MKDQNYVVKMEKAISEKWGAEAIQNPKAGWDQEKEKEYLEQLKEKEKRKRDLEKKAKQNLSKVARVCSTCEQTKIGSRHDVYFTKFSCCFDCYVQWIEGREQRWKEGWRPDKKQSFNLLITIYYKQIVLLEI